MKVLIADKFEKSGIDGLQALGCDVISEPDLQDQALADAMASTQPVIVIVRSTKITAPMMMTAPSVKLIIRAGAGYNTIDVKAASERGIRVANCPGKNSIAVAELAFGLMLSIDRRIPDNVADLRAGIWNKKGYSKARGIFGQTLGLLGIGNIGSLMIPRAKAFGMSIIVWDKPFDGQDREMTTAEAASLGLDVSLLPIHLAPTPADVAARCDVLSIHLALVPQTRGLVSADLLARMRPGSTLINCARGEIVDSAALTDAIRAKKIRAGLDVFGDEPSGASGVFADSIVNEPGVYGTHHIGASTDQAQEAIAAETVRIVRVFRDTGVAPNAVN